MKRLVLLTAVLLAACDTQYMSSGPGPTADPCASQMYPTPYCSNGYSWSAGYYGPSHVWVMPHYVRRTVVVVPSYHAPIYVHPTPVVVHSPSVVVVPRPVVQQRTTIVRPPAYVRSRPTVTTTTTRRYR